uniref:Uncharacterized protein n=1 Tax=Rhizophora mucronata TaxID=61149 RepID=A0A2P2NDU8_RHIMU
MHERFCVWLNFCMQDFYAWSCLFYDFSLSSSLSMNFCPYESLVLIDTLLLIINLFHHLIAVQGVV